MAQKRSIFFITTLVMLLLSLASCSVNPFRSNNNLTGTAAGTLGGAAIGGGVAALAGASKAQILLAGLAGGALGYYVSSLDFASGGVTHVGGQVFTLGDYATIEIPSEKIFDVNSADFLPEAGPILDSVVSVLNRYPHSNIMVSGNTSGYYTSKLERKISLDRARQVAAYLWAHGIINAGDPDSNVGDLQGRHSYTRKLSYVGYGDLFPISNNITPQGVLENSRIQITVYPPNRHLSLNKCGPVFNNIGALNEPQSAPDQTAQNSLTNTPSGITRLPENETEPGDPFKDDNQISSAKVVNTQGYDPSTPTSTNDSWKNYNSVSSVPQTASAPKVVKQGGFTGYKDELASR